MFSVDKMSRTPIYEQLIRNIELGIMSGQIKPDGQLPSVRALSQELGINPNTLQKAYAEIERRGLCHTVPGSGRFIEKDAIEKLLKSGSGRLAELEEQIVSLKSSGVKRGAIEEIIERVYSSDDNLNESKVILK